MGTRNFSQKNASRIFAFGMEDDYEDFMFDDDIQYAEDYITEQAKTDLPDYRATDGKYLNHTPHYSRDIEGTQIVMLSNYFSFMGVEFSIGITVFASSGYYEGANYDWDLTIGMGDYYAKAEDIDTSEYADHLEYALGSELKGLAKANAFKLKNKMDREAKKLSEQVEKYLSALCTDELRCIGGFSNGEGVYERVA